MVRIRRSNWPHVFRVAGSVVLLFIVVLLIMFSARSRNRNPSIVRGLIAPNPDALIDPATVDAFIVANLEQANLPGLALVVTKDDTIVYSAGYGHDSAVNAVTADTPMPIGSLSKSMTAFAVMQLVEQGLITLDEPVQTYLPELVIADPRGERITVRQLLNQTGGMADAGFPEMDLPQPFTLKEAVARLRTATLVADPGTEFNYHNPNYMVAARLVEIVSGQSFANYLHEYLFAPLGMAASRTVDRAESTSQWSADGYVFAYGQTIARPMLPHFFNGSGGVVTTANDLGQWLIMQNTGGTTQDGRRLLGAESVTLMHTPSPVNNDYAMGWEEDILADGTRRVEHGGTPFTFGADQALFPDKGYGFALLFNNSSTFGAEQLSFIEGLTNLILGTTPVLGMPVSILSDTVVAFLTLIALIRGVQHVRDAQRWVAARAAIPMRWTMLALAKTLIPIVVFANLPTVAGWVFGNRDVTWTSAYYGWLALVVWVGVGAAASLGILVSRSFHLLRQRRASSGPKRAREINDTMA